MDWHCSCPCLRSLVMCSILKEEKGGKKKKLWLTPSNIMCIFVISFLFSCSPFCVSFFLRYYIYVCVCVFFDSTFHKSNKLAKFHRLTETNSLLNDVLEAVRPHVNLTFDNILAHINTIYVLKTKSGALAGQGYLRLKVSEYHSDSVTKCIHTSHKQTQAHG